VVVEVFAQPGAMIAGATIYADSVDYHFYIRTNWAFLYLFSAARASRAVRDHGIATPLLAIYP
jgi:hypothetical protein